MYQVTSKDNWHWIGNENLWPMLGFFDPRKHIKRSLNLACLSGIKC